MDLISIGEVLIDFIPGEQPFSYIRKPGGAPANVAVAAARNQLEVGFYGKVGDDEFGRFLIQTLKENQVTPFVEEPTKEAVTTMAIVSLDQDGERSFTFVRKPGADMFLAQSDIPEEELKKARMVQGGSFSLSAGPMADTTRFVLQRASQLGKLVGFDVNYREFIWNQDEKMAVEKIKEVLPYVDLLKISEEETPMFGGEEALFSLMEEFQIAVIIETLGAKGARCYFKSEVRQLDGRKAKAVDATGAGDAFWGGFLSSILIQGLDQVEAFTMDGLEHAMQYGNIAGWLCVQTKGAMDSLPKRSEIEKYL